MTTKAAEKIVEALTQLVEGFAELQEQMEQDFGSSRDDESDEDDESEENSELEDAIVTEIRAAVESVVENEDCAPEDLATIVSALTDALQEIAPEVFADETESEESDEDEDEDEDDIDLDEDDYDYDEDDDEEDDDETEEDDEDEDE